MKKKHKNEKKNLKIERSIKFETFLVNVCEYFHVKIMKNVVCLNFALHHYMNKKGNWIKM